MNTDLVCDPMRLPVYPRQDDSIPFHCITFLQHLRVVGFVPPFWACILEAGNTIILND